MATIRTTCPMCGEVDIKPNAAHLTIEVGGRRGAYSFTCPKCTNLIAKPADKKIIALLLAADVPTTPAGQPKEEPPPPPPLTVDDLIGFHFELEQRGIEGFLA